MASGVGQQSTIGTREQAGTGCGLSAVLFTHLDKAEPARQKVVRPTFYQNFPENIFMNFLVLLAPV